MSIKKEITAGICLTETLEDNGNYNLVASAITPWHAISIDALIFYLQDKGIDINAAITICAHRQTGFAIDERFFVNDCATYYLDSGLRNNDTHIKKGVKTQLSIWKRICNVGNYYYSVFKYAICSKEKVPLYYVDRLPSVKLVWYFCNNNRKVVICYSDEGVATYMGTLKARVPIYHQSKGFNGFREYVRFYLIGNKLFCAMHKKETSKIFKQKPWGLVVNKTILPYYIKVFDRLNKKFELDLDKNIISRSIIICTSAWDRDRIKEQEDFVVLKRVCDFLIGQGNRLLLKTHPRDKFFETKIKDLGCDLLDTKGVPIECVCAYSMPKAIISFSSTALITAKVFWNISSICISDMLDRCKIDPFYLNEIDCFKRTFSKHIKFVKNELEVRL